MRTCAKVIFLLICLTIPSAVIAQELSPHDREKLRQAETVADRFVERFRQTLDFRIPWRELHSEKFRCQLLKSDVVTNVSDEEKAKIGTALLEKAYVALMNNYTLKGVHDLSIVRLVSYGNEEQFTAKEILKAEKSSPYTRTNGRSPKTAHEIEQAIKAFDRLSRLYRKHLPRNRMRSAAWKANYEYLTSRGGIKHLSVEKGKPDFCIAEDAKYYIVDRGLFYFYLVEEKGKMKVVGLGIGD